MEIGHWYYVTWYDAALEGVGDPQDAQLYARQFWGLYAGSDSQEGISFYKFGLGLDEGRNQDSAGWVSIPATLVTNTEEGNPSSQFKEDGNGTR